MLPAKYFETDTLSPETFRDLPKPAEPGSHEDNQPCFAPFCTIDLSVHFLSLDTALYSS